MRYLLLTAAGLAAAGPACAQKITLKPVLEARVRYEHVDQQGLATTESDGLTARVRAGINASSGPITATVIGQGNLGIVDDYYDGLEGAATRPLIADPENIALYVAQLQYKSKQVTITGGRQRIMLDDERFVGNVGFRQNAQTFDAVRVELTPIKKLKLDVSYAWDVRTIWGINGNGARQQGIGGNNVFANLSYATKIGTLTGFGYFVDQNEPVVQGYRLSSRTLGGRFAGSQALSKVAKLSYALSYAQQEDMHNNPNDYSADYWLADLTLDVKAWKLNAGYEVLGADKGVALTSFQTPLATGFKFQGWANKFLTTPPNGVRDLYAGASYGWKKVGKIDAITLQGVYHRFDSDILSQHYGDEIDLLASAKVKKYTFALRYAHYDASAFATDTDKMWVQLDWAF
jgi:hypothetical protein